MSDTTLKDGFNAFLTEEKITEVMEEVSDALSQTLGPYGSTTIIQSANLQHKISKDGYTVLTHLFYKDDLKRSIIEYIKKMSFNLVNKVGDGSTSSVITAAELMKVLRSFIKEQELPPSEVVNALEEMSHILQEDIKASSVKIDLETEKGRKDLYNINFISTNGDKKISELITEIYTKIGKMGAIQLESGKGDESSYVIKKGIELGRGMIDPSFANKRSDTKLTAEYNNARVIMTDGYVSMEILAHIHATITDLMDGGTPVLIIGNDFDKTFVETMVKFRQQYPEASQLVLVDIATNTPRALAKFEDIAAYINCEPYYGSSRNEPLTEESFTLERFGKASKIIVSDSKTLMIVEEEDQNIQRIEDRKNELLERVQKMTVLDDQFDYSSDIKELMARLAAFESGSAIIHVGGDTASAIETKKYLYEDAIFASRSALFEGFILGGNTSVFKSLEKPALQKKIVKAITGETVLSKEQAELLIKMVQDSFSFVYGKVINAANSNTIAQRIDFTKYNVLDGESNVDAIIRHCRENPSLIFNIRTLKFEKFGKTNIINSAATDAEIVKCTFSIVGLLATSSQFVRVPSHM